MIGNDAVNQCSRLLMNKPVIAVVWAGECRLDRVRIDNSRGTPMCKRRLMSVKRVGQRDAIVPLTDLPVPL